MAMAVEDALGERLTDGIAVVKILGPGTGLCVPGFRIGDIDSQPGRLRGLPGDLDLIDRAGPEDLFLCVMVGSSALMKRCPWTEFP